MLRVPVCCMTEKGFPKVRNPFTSPYDNWELKTHFDNAMKLIKLSLLAVATATLSVAAYAEPVTLSSGWVADFSPSMAEAANRSTAVFQLHGSYRLSTASNGDLFFDTSCVGIETDTTVGKNTTAKGSGRCEMKDKDGDKLLSAIDTVYDGITFKVEGGTGKWKTATGQLVSKEVFTSQSDTHWTGFGSGKGELNVSSKK